MSMSIPNLNRLQNQQLSKDVPEIVRDTIEQVEFKDVRPKAKRFWQLPDDKLSPQLPSSLSVPDAVRMSPSSSPSPDPRSDTSLRSARTQNNLYVDVGLEEGNYLFRRFFSFKTKQCDNFCL